MRAAPPEVPRLQLSKKAEPHTEKGDASVPGLIRWTITFRGVSLILTSLLVFVWPGIDRFLGVLVTYMVAGGVFPFIAGIKARAEYKTGWLWLTEGIVCALCGGCVLVITYWNLRAPYLIPTWAIVTGVLTMGTAIRLRKYVTAIWWLGSAGLTSIAFVIVMVLGATSQSWLLAGDESVRYLVTGYAIISGVLFIVFGYRVHNKSLCATRADISSVA